MSSAFSLFSQVSPFLNFWSRNASQTAFVSGARSRKLQSNTKQWRPLSRSIEVPGFNTARNFFPLVAPVTRLVKIVKTHVFHSTVSSSLNEILSKSFPCSSRVIEIIADFSVSKRTRREFSAGVKDRLRNSKSLVVTSTAFESATCD